MFTNLNQVSGYGELGGKKQRKRWRNALIGGAVIGAGIYGAKKFGGKLPNLRSIPRMNPTITGRTVSDLTPQAVSSATSSIFDIGRNLLSSRLSPRDTSLPNTSTPQSYTAGSMIGGIPPMGLVIGLGALSMIAFKLLK